MSIVETVSRRGTGRRGIFRLFARKALFCPQDRLQGRTPLDVPRARRSRIQPVNRMAWQLKRRQFLQLMAEGCLTTWVGMLASFRNVKKQERLGSHRTQEFLIYEHDHAYTSYQPNRFNCCAI